MTDLLRLCLVCLRIGALVFGGGFVFIPMLQSEVVDRYHWVTQQQFVDAVGLGHLTPGPILVSTTFVGYKVGQETGGLLGGVWGALAATLCIFVPSFLMTLVAGRYLPRLKSSPWVRHFLWGVRAAVVGLVTAAAVDIARGSCTEPAAMAVAAIAAVLLVWRQFDAGLVVVLSGLAGLAIWRG